MPRVGFGLADFSYVAHADWWRGNEKIVEYKWRFLVGGEMAWLGLAC